jgi:hypothetical protein
VGMQREFKNYSNTTGKFSDQERRDLFLASEVIYQVQPHEIAIIVYQNIDKISLPSLDPNLHVVLALCVYFAVYVCINPRVYTHAKFMYIFSGSKR